MASVRATTAHRHATTSTPTEDPATTPVELITFDRTARRGLGSWTAARDARRRVKDALAAASPGGGTELGEALNLAATTIGDDPARVVVITDAILSTRVTGSDLLGAAQMPVNLTTLDVIVPVVAGAPMPDRAVLDPLAAAFHGKVIALRTSEVDDRLATLPRQLADDLPLRDLGVVVDDEVMALDHSGPPLAVILHGAAVKLLLFALLLTEAVLPVGSLSAPAALGGIAGGVLVVTVGVGLVESLLARLAFRTVPLLLTTAFLMCLFALLMAWKGGAV